MEYIKLVIGVALALGLTWILIRNAKNTSVYNNVFMGIDTIIGIFAGLLLIISSLRSII